MPGRVPEIGFLIDVFEAVDPMRPSAKSGGKNGVFASIGCCLGMCPFLASMEPLKTVLVKSASQREAAREFTVA